jgi:hypothetical protein
MTLPAGELSREAIEAALVAAANAFFGTESTSRRRALDDIASIQCEPGSVLAAKKRHPIMEALQWLPIVEDSKLVEYVRQYVIIVEGLASDTGVIPSGL